MENYLQICLYPKKVCMFSGNREYFGEKEEELSQAVKKVMEMGVDTFLTGMAQGFDLYASECVLKIKEKADNIKLIACIPFYGQEKSFSKKDRERYETILKKADEKIVLKAEYSKGCFFVRNKYMVERADVLIAYDKKEKGGTRTTVDLFLKKKGNNIIFL